MLQNRTHRLLLAIAGLLLFTLPSMALEPVQGNLVSAQWLARNRDAPDLLILDASPPPAHAKQHIPGAVPVDVFTLASFGVREVPVAQIERIYQSMGLAPGKKVVMYDQGGTWFAPRLFFALSYHGFPVQDMYILDGGLAKWQADGLPVTKEATTAPAPGTFRITKVDEALRARMPELVAASGDRPNKVLVDALGPEYHYGAAAFFNKAGHIPHAVLLPSEDLFKADKTFKSPEEMRRMLAHLSIRPEQEIHSHCGGGGAAAVPYFALKHILGYPKVKLSLESQMGWLQDERDLPFWTYAAPHLMREADWLGSWGGKMMRMYGISRVSVVDVRPAAAYEQGHVPFALSVPADTFRGNIANPSRLAEILGAAGVNAQHEAVIVSGGGITRESALAFVMLEKLGQAKVSVLMDPLDSPETLDRMARKGFALTKEATIVGKPQKPTDLAVPPAAYTVNVRQGVTVAGLVAPQGPNPKVYIASSASLPKRVPDGKVVHVPYTELLKPDGSPKEAKDIWKILEKAGVPRYAELVAFSDDPGEAAVTYFVLRLMGFPDAKVLVS